MKINKIFGKLMIIIFLLIEVYPIIWMLMTSFKSPAEFVTKPSYALPEKLYVKNYIDAWIIGKMNIFFKNSIFTTSAALIFILLFSSMAAFALSKMKWKLRRLISAIFMAGILVPVQVVLIPLFIIYKQIGLINTLIGLSMVYIAFGLSMSIFLFLGYYNYIPDELIEAAVIDGCSIYRIFSGIVFPLIKNAIVTVLVIQFFVTWNDLIFSMTFISNQRLKTIQTGLLYFQNEYGVKEWGPIFASISIAIMPTIVLYASLNKLVIKGMTAGAIKA